MSELKNCPKCETNNFELVIIGGYYQYECKCGIAFNSFVNSKEELDEKWNERGSKVKEFTLFWLTGKSEIVKGTDPSNAMNNAGIGAGALAALDFHVEGDLRDQHEWSDQKRTWMQIKKVGN